MPITTVLYVAEGPWINPPGNGLEKFKEALTSAKTKLDRGEGFISASLRWRPKGKFLVNKSPRPSLLGENPPHYPVAGIPELAFQIEKAAQAAGLWAEATEEWGLDPGHWHPLQLLNPLANRAVVPLSLSQMSPEAHRKWGVTVRRGTQKWPKPLTLVITGSLSTRSDLSGDSKNLLNSVEKFDKKILDMVEQGTIGQLDEMDRNLFRIAQPEGGLSSLYFLWGVIGENLPGTLEYYHRHLPGIGSAIFLFNLEAKGLEKS